MKRRWVIYLIVGIVFGVVDFFYQGFLSNFRQQQAFTPSLEGEIAWLVLIIGIWLLPIFPIVLYEARISRSRLRSALASLSTWCASIVFYYLTNAAQLAFLGVPGRPELHISNRSAPFFWENWASVFWQDIILGGITEWIMVAVVGGFIVGFLVSFFYLYFRKTS